MEFSDNRGREIVYMSSCLLNQNARAAGVAVHRGAYRELIRILLEREVGIEQLPCPECVLWGGVARPALYRRQPLALRTVGTRWFPVVEAATNMWSAKSRLGCRRLAARVVDRMQDFVANGYRILGVVGVNDSPTCGVTKIVDLLDVVRNHEAWGMSNEDLEHPDVERFRELMAKAQIDGTGVLMRAIADELERRGLEIPMVGAEPWVEPEAEARRVASVLGISLSE